MFEESVVDLLDEGRASVDEASVNLNEARARV